ncbi:MAG TPA: hypothetical protein VJY35_09490, partial [Candidatus Eisenbacteria bacterium]|nr:hypothetical protein [Candidatus Eisenbacteria bacterium]
PANTAPVVSAGSNQTITMPAAVVLDGTVTDDNLPAPPSLTTTWSKVSGPGTVSFVNANAVDTQASFSLSGSYVLRLTASDGQLSNNAQVTITVLLAPSTNDWRVATSGDDSEEIASGSVYTNSSDLELVFDGSNQTVGLRFQGVLIPKGAQIPNAYIQFTADEAQADSTVLTIQAVASDNAAPFGTAKFSLSSLPRGSQSATWTPVPWTTVNEAGLHQRTVNIGPVIQQVVGRAGWVSGNSIAIIITGIGHRTARAYDNYPTLAPLLHVDLGAAASAAQR